MRDWVGSWVKQGYDAVTGHEDARDAGKDKDPTKTFATQMGPSPTNKHGMEFDMGTGAWKNQPANSIGPTTLY